MKLPNRRIVVISILIFICCAGIYLYDEYLSLPPSVSGLVLASFSLKSISESDLNEQSLKSEDLVRAIKYINSHQDYTCYHLLIAIRRDHADVFQQIPKETQAKILCSALKKAQWFNDWGYLVPGECFDDEIAQALIQTGKPALKYLLPILDDESRAPHWGSEIATVSEMHQLRRSDFAFRYAQIILGKTPTFNPDSNVRDAEIATLKAELTNRED
jgi:hypothetical protein